MTDLTAAFDYSFPLGSDNHDGSGKMECKFIHSTVATGLTGHRLHLDYVSFEKVSTTNQIASDIAAVKAATDRLQFTLANDVKATLDSETVALTAGQTIAATVADKADYTLTAAYDAAKTAAQAGTALTTPDIPTPTQNAAAVLARALDAESYAADGEVPTLSQALWMLWGTVGDYLVSGTTLTVRKQDGTAAMTFTLDDATAPTSRTRTT
jgi:hypothetical protein